MGKEQRGRAAERRLRKVGGTTRTPRGDGSVVSIFLERTPLLRGYSVVLCLARPGRSRHASRRMWGVDAIQYTRAPAHFDRC